MALRKTVSLAEAAKQGKLKKYLLRYFKTCLPPKNADPKRVSGQFPNLAGFCFWFGCRKDEVEALKDSDPDAAELILNGLENAALNTFFISPTVLSIYLKKRMGYAEKNEAPPPEEADFMRIIFEHNIEEDSA